MNMEDSYKTRTRESEVGESPTAQGQPGLHGKFQGNMRPPSQKKKKKERPDWLQMPHFQVVVPSCRPRK